MYAIADTGLPEMKTIVYCIPKCIQTCHRNTITFRWVIADRTTDSIFSMLVIAKTSTLLFVTTPSSYYISCGSLQEYPNSKNK